MEMQNKPTEKKEEGFLCGLAKKVMAFLNLDDASKIQAFFNRETKHSLSEIKAKKHNITTAKLDHERQMVVLVEKLEDAELSLEDAKMAITVEDVKTNDLMDDFGIKYWRNIDAKQDKINQLKLTMENLTKAHEERVAKIQVEIDTHEARIAIMSK